MVILMAVSGVSYGFVTAFMPRSYSDSLNRTLAARAKQLAESLSGYTLENALSVMEEFSSANQSRVVLLDENGGIVREWNGLGDALMITSEIEGSSEGVSEEFASTVETMEADNIQTEEGVSMVEQMEQQAMGRYEVAFKGTDHKYTLFVFGSTQLVNQAVEALGQILPWMLLTVFAVSLLIALFYSRYLSKPVQKLGAASDKMANLDFSVRTDMKRIDEIGVLSRSLDTMAESLDQALSSLWEANAKLKDEMEQERELDRQRMAFFSAASHELKTPVTILKGQLAGMLEGVDVYQDRDRYLLRSLQVTARMENLIQEMLAVSRVETRGADVRREPVELSTLLVHQLTLDAELMEQRGQRLVSTLTPGITVTGDTSLLGKAIGNLLSNASLYSPEGAEIRVWCGMMQGRTALTVENTGTHIGAEALPHLFEAFYREEASRNRSTGGSGLGLYLVRIILERHGASCSIENTAEGVKATVHFGDFK